MPVVNTNQLKKAIKDYFNGCHDTVDALDTREDILNIINNVSYFVKGDTIQAVHGHWDCVDPIFNTWQCSACKELWTLNDGTPKENNMNYCFACGAMMDGDIDAVNRCGFVT